MKASPLVSGQHLNCSTSLPVNILLWMPQKRGVSYVIHYLDDFLTIGPHLSPVCQQYLNTFIGLCSELGIPLACNKVEGSSTTLTFLGIIIDNQRMEIRLPTINEGTSRDTLMMHLLHCLWLFVAYFDITISATHLPGATNITADCLSRNNTLQAFQATPCCQCSHPLY